MIAILGSGFGLYGYLPALAGLAGQQVILPERYRPRFLSRSELAPFAPNIIWVESEDQALGMAECVVIALRPSDQPPKVRACLDRPNIRRFMLEKPLAATENEAGALLDLLVEEKRPFRVGYSFCVTPWAEQLRQLHASPNLASVEIKWHFMAHHFKHEQNNWKRAEQDGGGPLRFYGIQALALFAELGYRRVISSTLTARAAGEADRWVATLDGAGLPIAQLIVDSRAEDESFVVSTGGQRVLMQGRTPFDDVPEVTTFVGIDRRAPLLYKLFQSFDDNAANDCAAYFRTQELWRQAEAKLDSV